MRWPGRSRPSTIAPAATSPTTEGPIPEPLVSAVIPTLDRPRQLREAVRSVLAQSLSPIELIVVSDPGDRATAEMLDGIEDGRLRVVDRPAGVGPGGARNAGVAAARGEWIAFLDDDDEWYPDKLEVQLGAARASSQRYPIVASRVVCRTASADGIRPRRLPAPGEHLSEYLLAQRSLFWPDGLVHTSTLFARRDLLERVPFRADLPKYEDWDWLLRASALEEGRVTFVRDSRPLSVWNLRSARPTASSMPDWELGRSWLREVAGLVTRRAYSSFLLTEVSANAAAQRCWRALWALPQEAFARGAPRPLDLMRHAAVWLLPAGLRRRAAMSRLAFLDRRLAARLSRS